MRVTIVGAGDRSRGIHTRLVAGGNDVELVDNDPEDARALAQELAGHDRGSGATPAAAGDRLGLLHISLPGRLGTESRSAVKFLR